MEEESKYAEVIFVNKIPSGILKDRFITDHGDIYKKNSDEEFVKPFKTGSGLLRVQAGTGDKRVEEFIHILVAKAFIPIAKELPYVIHLDGDLVNNHYKNLKWSIYPDLDYKDFKTIPGYSDYKISIDATVKSYKFKHAPKIMTPNEDEHGYFHLSIVNDKGKKVTNTIYQLLALTYIPNPDNLPEVDHIDRNKANNHISNLRWADKPMQGKNKINGENCTKSIKQYSLDGEFMEEYKSGREAIKILGLKVGHSALRKCATRNEDKLTFTSAGYKWQYVDKKKEPYVLEDGEIAVKTIGIFGTVEIDFPYNEITNFGNLLDRNGIKMTATDPHICPTFGMTNSDTGVSKTMQAHTLVGLFFVEGRTEEKNELDHLDEKRSNPRFDNLEWVTHQENCRRAGHKHFSPVNKIDPETGEILESFESVKAAALAAGASISSISGCCRGRSQFAHGSKYEYA